MADLYNMEKPKSFKITYDLNDECLNPQTIEKGKVNLAALILGESRRKACKYYAKKLRPGMGDNLEFLKTRC